MFNHFFDDCKPLPLFVIKHTLKLAITALLQLLFWQEVIYVIRPGK